MQTSDLKEERLLLLESWKDFEVLIFRSKHKVIFIHLMHCITKIVMASDITDVFAFNHNIYDNSPSIQWAIYLIYLVCRFIYFCLNFKAVFDVIQYSLNVSSLFLSHLFST